MQPCLVPTLIPKCANAKCVLTAITWRIFLSEAPAKTTDLGSVQSAIKKLDRNASCAMSLCIITARTIGDSLRRSAKANSNSPLE